MTSDASSAHPVPSTSPASQGTVRTLARLIPFARPAMPRLALGMVAALAAGVVTLCIPLVLESLIDGPLASGDIAQIWAAGGLVLGLGVAEAVFIALRRWLVLTPGTVVEASMRNALFAHLQRLPVAFHDRWQSGQLLSRAVSDLGLIRRWLSFGLVLLVVNVVTVVIGAVVLFTWSPVLGAVFLVMCLPIWVIGFRFEKSYSVLARRGQDQSGDLATAVEESVHGIRVLKAFGRGPFALARFRVQADQLRSTEESKARAVAGILRWLVMLPDLAFALCLLAGVWLAADGQLSVGELFAFFATAAILRFPLESVGFLLSMTFDTRTAVDRYFEVMDAPVSIDDPEDPARPFAPRGATGALRFRGVRFRYPDAGRSEPALLDGVDLDVRPGETMALVGLTGSGKTTLTALVTRFHDVDAGRIELDGVDIRDLTLEQLRTEVAMAFEDATLFSASVRHNVLLGRPELDERGAEGERVLDEALRIAQADFVDELPEGRDTEVGEEGLSLSGGQRQRLALARAVAAAPSVLVMDDPLSALDVDTETRVTAELRTRLRGTTALVVAHRPSTVALADRVALLDGGRVAAVGTHAELMAASARYRAVLSSLDDEAGDEAARAGRSSAPDTGRLASHVDDEEGRR
ncbi:ABC transporter ATP-binding protein [Mycetocola reblochoni]|uniref:ABC transporter ATP-binding protein n=1 Tax=Mycetocola reblochoni TaxID=331618 RepID=UPI0026A2AA0D